MNPLSDATPWGMATETEALITLRCQDKDRLLGDTLRGGRGKDFLLGGDDNDLLIGGRAPDQLLGGSGNDTLRGDAGKDLLLGGSGANWFILEQGQGPDTVIDCDADLDTLGLTPGLTLGQLSATSEEGNTHIFLADSEQTLMISSGVTIDFVDLNVQVYPPS